jgi:WD40 repeat protein
MSESPQLLKNISLESSENWQIDFAMKQDNLISCGNNGTISLIDIESGDVQTTTRVSDEFHMSIKVLQNDKILTGNQAGELFILSSDLSEKNKISNFCFRNIRHIDYGIDSNKVFVVSDDLGIYSFDLEKEQIENTSVFEGHLDVITSMECMYQKPMILTGSLDGTVRFWDSRTGKGNILMENKETEFWGVKYFEPIDKIIVGDSEGIVSILDY